jgi:hypothetical protein
VEAGSSFLRHFNFFGNVLWQPEHMHLELGLQHSGFSLVAKQLVVFANTIFFIKKETGTTINNFLLVTTSK